ncbi:MAG: hypothetical protein GQE15_13605 [Archangiaceae bacterium]|nr:hypothetical protein [Archangiaceae bacterium]
MSAPVVCPSCSRVFQPTLTACPQCGWETELSAEHRRTKQMAVDKLPMRLAKIELVKEPRAAPRLELPAEDRPSAPPAPALRLPDEEPTDTHAAAPRLPNEAPPLRLPGEEPAATPLRLPGEAAETPLSLPGGLRLPGEAAAPRAAPAVGAFMVHTVNESEAAAARHSLELPSDGSDEPRAPPPRASAARPAPVTRAARPERPPTALPGWLTDTLDPSARLGLVLTSPLALLVAIDVFTAGRAEVSSGPLWIALLALIGSVAGLVQLHRATVAAVLLAGSVLAATSAQRPGLAAAFFIWMCTALASALWPRARAAALAGGVGSLAVFAPLALDGVLARPVLGEWISGERGEVLHAPFVDQATGLQLPVTTPSPRVTSTVAGTTRLHDAALGLELGLAALPRDRALTSAMTDAQLWLEAQGLSRVTFGEPADQRGAFDAATQTTFTALLGRARISGIVRVAVLGNETFAIAAWAREHRQQALEASARPVIEQAFFRPPLRPRLAPAIREAVTPTVVTTLDGAATGVRVSVGGAIVLLLPSNVPDTTQRLLSTQGPFPVQLTEGTVTNGVRLVVLGGGAGAPLRRSQQAPTFTRVVRVADGFSGGWLADAPCAERRAIELPDTRPGPVFDLDGKLVGFAASDTAELVTTDTLETAFTRIVGRPTTIEAATLTTPAPLYEVVAPAAPAPEADASSLSRSVLLARSAVGVTAAVVVRAGESGWALVADSSIAPPGASVSITLPSEEVRGVDVVRTTGRVVLLRAPRVEGDELQPLKLMDAIPEGSTRRLAWGFREDPARSTLALKSVHGELSPDGFDPDPAPAMTGGPVLTPDGHVAALRVGAGQSITTAPKIQALSVAGVSDVLWRVVAEPTGECQLAARVLLEDPLEEATAVRVRFEPASADTMPARLKVAALTDALPRKGLAEFVFRLPCWTKPQWMQFEVQSPGAVRATKVQRLPVITTLPGTLAGRAGATEGCSRPPSSEVASLWEFPPRVSMQHACRLKPTECERACYVDELDACTLDGRHALSVGEISRALGRLDPLCANGDVEACTLLAWAVAEKKSGRQPKAKSEAVLQPWCDAGNARACAALSPAEWKKQLEALKKACVPNSGRCAALGRHLLIGPRLDTDVKLALGELKLACGEGDAQACAESATESLRFERESELDAMPRATAACRGKQAAGCLLEALNAARGLTVPRTPQAAEKLIADTCAAGSETACLMDYR